MNDKREKMLTMRVTEEAHRQLLDRCDGKQLAAWMRQPCLGETPARSGRLPTLAPALLRQVAGMGNNQNQSASRITTQEWTGTDRDLVGAALLAIEQDLAQLRLTARLNGGNDDR